MIGCDCPVCTSDDPRDRRTRTSVLVEVGGKNLLIDTGPELRLQCVACGISRVDAVLYTHAHADHVVGLDDLRQFNHLQKAVLTCYANRQTMAVLKRMFHYAFEDTPDYPSAKPRLKLAELDGVTEIAGVAVTPVPLMHGELAILGFRFGRFAYCTDCSAIPDTSMALLEGLDVLVLTGLRHRPHPTHLNITQAVEMAGRIGAQQTYFTHIAHELGHEATNAALPANMALAYDGQVIELG